MSEKTHENIYDEDVAPLMTRIIEICQKHKIPMFASFLLEPETDMYCTTHLPGDDRLARCARFVQSPVGDFIAMTISKEPTIERSGDE